MKDLTPDLEAALKSKTGAAFKSRNGQIQGLRSGNEGSPISSHRANLDIQPPYSGGGGIAYRRRNTLTRQAKQSGCHSTGEVSSESDNQTSRSDNGKLKISLAACARSAIIFMSRIDWRTDAALRAELTTHAHASMRSCDEAAKPRSSRFLGRRVLPDFLTLQSERTRHPARA